MFTGLPPTAHGVRSYEDGAPGGAPKLPRVLPDGFMTLAEVLRRNGYGTGAFTGCGNVNKELGFGREFDVHLQGLESPRQQPCPQRARAERCLDSHDRRAVTTSPYA